MDPLNRRQFACWPPPRDFSAGRCAGCGGGGSVSGPAHPWSSHPGQSSAAERELIGVVSRTDSPLCRSGADRRRQGLRCNAALIEPTCPTSFCSTTDGGSFSAVNFTALYDCSAKLKTITTRLTIANDSCAQRPPLRCAVCSLDAAVLTTTRRRGNRPAYLTADRNPGQSSTRGSGVTGRRRVDRRTAGLTPTSSRRSLWNWHWRKPYPDKWTLDT